MPRRWIAALVVAGLSSLLLAAGLSVGGAEERTIALVARAHVEGGGPLEACCGRRGYGQPPPGPDCAQRAETVCAFAREGRVTSLDVNVPPKGMPTVQLTLAGPHGTGDCTLHLLERTGNRGKSSVVVEDCTCTAR